MPNSRNEEILNAIVEGSGSQDLKAPQSREEALLKGVLQKLDNDVGDIKTEMGDLADLDTTDKSTLVAAINEAARSGGDTTKNMTRGEKIVDISNYQPDVDYGALIEDTALIILRAGYRGTAGGRRAHTRMVLRGE